jgi:hypothetical protein
MSVRTGAREKCRRFSGLLHGASDPSFTREMTAKRQKKFLCTQKKVEHHRAARRREESGGEIVKVGGEDR